MSEIAYKAALQFHADIGADEALLEEPVDATALKPEEPSEAVISSVPQSSFQQTRSPMSPSSPALKATVPNLAEKRAEAARLAEESQTREELQQAIQSFDGLEIKKTATNIVFSDGNPAASVMLIGEAPGADEDRLGKPFVGQSGQLLDKILYWIGLERTAEEPEKALYISNILNWRPPGNRTPTPEEMAISLPFIERHIALIQPKLLILAGGTPTKALLHTTSGISRLRGRFHDYTPQTVSGSSIPALATYHPAYLLRSPSQKGLVWQDMLLLLQKRREMGVADL